MAAGVSAGHHEMRRECLAEPVEADGGHSAPRSTPPWNRSCVPSSSCSRGRWEQQEVGVSNRAQYRLVRSAEGTLPGNVVVAWWQGAPLAPAGEMPGGSQTREEKSLCEATGRVVAYLL